jgi:hypothetical protein
MVRFIRSTWTIGPGMFGLGKMTIDVVASTSHLEGRNPEWLAALKHAL